MANTLDMALDDIIKTNKKTSGAAGRGRRGGRGNGLPAGGAGGVGGPRRREFKRSAPQTVAKAPEDAAWQHDMYREYPAPAISLATSGRVSAIETGTKLYISNLDYGVSNDDIKELFSEVGDLKRSSVHYDRSGRSKGTAEIVFARRADALEAVKKYNNVQLDGKPMKIELLGTNISTPGPALGSVQNGRPAASNGRAKGVITEQKMSRRGGRRRGSKVQGKGSKQPPSAADLDADLEKYHSEAMQTN